MERNGELTQEDLNKLSKASSTPSNASYIKERTSIKDLDKDEDDNVLF